MTKKSRQKFKYLENEKKERAFFIFFKRAFTEANKINFFEGDSPTLMFWLSLEPVDYSIEYFYFLLDAENATWLTIGTSYTNIK